MAVSYLTTYLVTGREIRERVDAAQPLSQLTSGQVYARVQATDHKPVVDVTAMLVRETAIDFTQGLAAFLAARLTDLALARYTSTALPLPDPASGRFLRRVEALDGHADPSLTVAYTALGTPDVRNDAHRRGQLNDLVLSSPSRDLTHCLAAVNGVFHRCLPYQGELFVVDGYANMKNAKKTALAVYDTRAVGGHRIIALDDTMISNTEAQDLRHSIYLTLPADVDLSNKTTWLVIDGRLHACDGAYAVLGPRQLKIRTGRLELLTNWIHNPNTVYREDLSGQEIRDPYAPPPDPLAAYHALSLAQKLDHYMTTTWPFSGRSGQPHTGAAFTGYAYVDRFPKEPPLAQKIETYFTRVYPTAGVERDGRAAGVSQFKYSALYEAAVEITQTIPRAQLDSVGFVQNALLSQHSYLIVLNTPRLYTRVYPLIPTTAPTQYEYRGRDTPRGLLRYAGAFALPYVLYTAPDGQHTVSIEHAKLEQDLFTQAHQPLAIPAPYFDATASAPQQPAELIEFFAP